MTLIRHSSRRVKLDQNVFQQRLEGAASYDRIAGYFRSSLFEVAGEALKSVAGKVRIVCNSDLDAQDVVTAAAVQAALRRSWCKGRPEDAPPEALPRYQALYEALSSGKMEVRVLPDCAFGLIHGKAGVIRRADGSAVAFMGSVNESLSAWKLNYELLWEDTDPATVAWVQEEFDALWTHPQAVDLACCPFIEQDVQRILVRKVVEPEEWKATSDPAEAAASAAVETPVYRRDQGLWPHQKYFARLALERHRLGGARLVLADQVGLGKTVQLAMAALLMALEDPDGPAILVLAPKPLLQQWQDELMELLDLPSARWTGRSWVDENDVEHPSDGVKHLGKCPRRIGLVSQGLVVRGQGEAVSQLLSRSYTCVIVDEAHRVRRRKVPKVDAGADEVDEKAEPNKLLLGTDAASEGLNLQRLGTLINIDLPWNPTRLEQRKGRIQRIGQARSEVWIANLRYRGSVEDRVHQVLADRLEAIHGLFGQIPDTLEDVWVKVALNDEKAASQLIDRTAATRNPFDAKYSKVEDDDWETCASVLNGVSMKELLSKAW